MSILLPQNSWNLNTLSLFRHKDVRDLAWALLSPNIVQDQPGLIEDEFWRCRFEEAFEWLRELDRAPQTLSEYLAKRAVSNRLGERFELLLLFWLEHFSGFTILGHRVQVRDSSRTLGEFDFLLQRGSENFHWEVAVKFYLGVVNESGEQWIGLNPADTLEAKLLHLTKDQLFLRNTEGAQSILHALGVEDLTCRFTLKGYLFSHVRRFVLNDSTKNARFPTGWWCFRSELEELSFEGVDRVAAVPRKRWLSPDHALSGDLSNNLSKTYSEFQKRAQGLPLPLMVIGLKRFRSGALLEVSRGIVIGDEWNQPDGKSLYSNPRK